MMEAFIEGGWGMYPTLVCGLALLAVAVRYAVSPDRKAVALLVSLGIMTLASGCLGFVTGVIKTTHALPEIHGDPTLIAFLGIGESLNNVGFALVFAMLAGLCASIGSARTWRGGGSPTTAEKLPATQGS